MANVFSDRPTDAVRLLADRPDDEEIPAPLLKEWTRLEAFATASAGNPAEGIRVLSRVRQPVDAENIVRDVELLATLASPSPDICQATADVFENLHALSPGVRGRIARLVGDLYCLSGHDEDALT